MLGGIVHEFPGPKKLTPKLRAPNFAVALFPRTFLPPPGSAEKQGGGITEASIAVWQSASCLIRYSGMEAWKLMPLGFRRAYLRLRTALTSSSASKF